MSDGEQHAIVYMVMHGKCEVEVYHCRHQGHSFMHAGVPVQIVMPPQGARSMTHTRKAKYSHWKFAREADMSYNLFLQTRGGAVWQLVGLITRRS